MKPTKDQKKARDFARAQRIAARQWWAGLHSRWWYIATNGHL